MRQGHAIAALIVVAARVDRDRNIPPIEQIASAAAAALNIMLAAHAQGYGAMWKTGARAYDAKFSEQCQGVVAIDGRRHSRSEDRICHARHRQR
jgi:nitroreductase